METKDSKPNGHQGVCANETSANEFILGKRIYRDDVGGVNNVN